jgi:hypothetical protein
MKPSMDSVLNEYVFSLSEPLSESEIRQVFAQFQIAELTEINKRNHSYKIKFSKDPGIEVLNETIRQSGKFRFIEKNSIFKKS